MDLLPTLNNLVSVIEQHTSDIQAWLQPGIPRSTLTTTLAAFDLSPPEKLLALYEWHNGQIPVPPAASRLFGEYAFLSIDDAIGEYEGIQQYYRMPDIQPLGYKTVLPVRKFSGAVLYDLLWA